MSMYYSDKPIDKISEDRLDRKGFAKTMATTLFDLKQTDTFTVGLLGKWGVGKTSLVNLVLSELKEIDNKNESKTLIVKFDPWHFTDTTQLISQFLIRLADEFKGKKKRILDKIGDALINYSVAFDLAEYIPLPYAGMAGKIGKTTMNFIGKGLKNNKIDQKNILKQKEYVVDLLEKEKQRILIIIDDIDRLSNEQIREVFQLVSSVAKFPYVTYLLVFDKDVVIKALEKVQEGDGNDYLEKIIQVPIEIPPIKKSKLFDLLFQELTKLSNLFPDIPVVKERWSEVFNKCVYPFISTIRDVNRLLNLLQYKFCGIPSDVDFSDMVAISVIELFQPNIYKWVKQNKNILVGIATGESLLEKKDTHEKCKERYTAIIEKLVNGTKSEEEKNDNVKNTMLSLTTLFPPFAKKIGQYYTLIDSNESRKHNYIYNEDKFDRYFSLDIDDVGIRSSIVEKAIFTSSFSDLKQTISNSNSDGNIYEFLEEIRARTLDLNSDRAIIVGSVLLECLSDISKLDRKSLFGFSSQSNALHIAYGLFNKIDNCVRLNTIDNIISHMTVDNIDGVAQFINLIELAYGRLAANGQEKIEIEKIITLDELLIVEKSFINRSDIILEHNSLFDSQSWTMAYWLIKSLNEKYADKLMKKELSDDKHIVKFLRYFVSQWEGSGISYEIRQPIDYLSKEQILAAINNLRKDKTLFSLDDEYKNRAGAYYLAMTDTEKAKDHISQKEVIQLLSEWNK